MLSGLIQQAIEAKRLFRVEFLGQRARSLNTGAEGVICGGGMDLTLAGERRNVTLELKTESGIEYGLSLNHVEMLVDPSQLPKLPEPEPPT